MTDSSLPDPLSVNQLDFDDPATMRAFHNAWFAGCEGGDDAALREVSEGAIL
jgi:hypothetical protein